MNIYKVTKESPNANSIVAELNAAVLTGTFKGSKGTNKADLYTSKHTHSMLVAHGSCAPSNATFVETVIIEF
jgi:hypothetical protein